MEGVELMLEQFFKSVFEQDEAAVVICDLNHTIVHLNPAAAKRYEASIVIGMAILSDAQIIRKTEPVAISRWDRQQAYF